MSLMKLDTPESMSPSIPVEKLKLLSLKKFFLE